MTIDLSLRKEPSPTRRHSFMRALSATETLLSETTAMPTSVDIMAAAWDPEPVARFYFHNDPAAALEFAAQFHLTVTETVRADGSTYTEAKGQWGNVAVWAWALLRADEAPESAEVSA